MIGLGSVPETSIPKFPLGEIVITSGALTKIKRGDIQAALRWYQRGNWGESEPEFRRQNDERVEKGGTLASIYQDSCGVKFYIITEADRSVTTILLPEEY
jgi:hypothetical protein